MTTKTNKLKEVNVGSRSFGNYIDISDPCYNRDAEYFDRCGLKDIHIVPGDYHCNAELIAEGTVRGVPCYRVAALQITHKDAIFEEDEFAYIGDIAVDAGVAGFFAAPKHYYKDNDEWYSFCNLLKNKDYLEIDNGFDSGFVSESGYGDGCYEVWGVYDEEFPECLCAIRIEFIDPNEEEEQ